VELTGRFFRWCKKLFDLPLVLQDVRDGRQQGQVVYGTRQMAAWTLCYCLAMARSNANFTQVYGRRRGVQLLTGLMPGQHPSQDTFEYVLRRFNSDSIRRVRRNIIKKMRSLKMFGGRVVVAIDAKEIPLPHGRFEECGQRMHESGVVTYFYKVIIVSLIGPNVPPVILGVALDRSANELPAARVLLRDVIYRYGARFIDVIVGDRLYVDHTLVNELKRDFGVDMVVEAKTDMRVLEEGRALLELDDTAPSYGTIVDGSDEVFRFREIRGVAHEWAGLDVPELRFIEAHQVSPWPDPRHKRTKRTRYILTTLQYGTAEWVHRCLRWRWWLENANWDLEHRFQIEHLPSQTLAGITAYLEFLALAYTLFHAFVRRQLGGFEALKLTLSSLCDIFTRDLYALDEHEAARACLTRTG
jgi:hypothetical protein